MLISFFLEKTRIKTDKPIKGFKKGAMEYLMRYSWPGNIRELINVIEYGFVVCPGGLIGTEHLPGPLLMKPRQPRQTGHESQDEEGYRIQLLKVLKECDGNKSEAARRLGISRVTLWKRLKKLNITVNRSVLMEKNG
jgi:DNA-binding NtrC family response regulator